MSINYRNALSTAGRGTISFILLWVVISQVGFKNIIENVLQIPLSHLFFAVLLSVLGVGLSAYKWNFLLASHGLEIRFLRAWVYYYIGVFFNTFLPSVIGGDTARAYYLYSDTGNSSSTVSSVVVERITGLFSICTLVISGTLVAGDLMPSRIQTVTLGSALTVLILLSVFTLTEIPRPFLRQTIFQIDTYGVGERMKRLYDAIQTYRSMPITLLYVFILSLIFRLVLIASNYTVAVGLGMDVPIYYYILTIPLVEFLLFLPISIQGFGVRESAYLYMFSAVGVTGSTALALGFLMQVILRVINNLIGGIVYVLYEYLSY